MSHSLPELPYSPEALAPAMSRETIDYHYGKHLKTYIDNLNRLIPGTPFEDATLEEMILKADGGIFNNAAQTWNHTFFFNTLTPSPIDMPQALKTAIERDFGFRRGFQDEIPAGCRDSVRLWLGMAVGRQGRKAVHIRRVQCRKPSPSRSPSAADRRCLGACVLYRLPQPQGRLSGCLVESCGSGTL